MSPTWKIILEAHTQVGATNEFDSTKLAIEYIGSRDEARALAQDFANLMARTNTGSPVVIVEGENADENFWVGRQWSGQ